MPITNIAIYNSVMTTYGAYAAQKAQAHPSDVTGVATVDYDGQMTHYRISDYTGASEPWNTYATYARAPYRDFLLLGGGGTPAAGTYSADKTAMLAIGADWLPFIRDAMVDFVNRDSDGRIYASYYDPMYYALRAKQDGLLNSTLCDQIVANFRTQYRDTYVPASGNSPGVPFLYTRGLMLDYILNGQTASKTAIANINATSGYINNPTTMSFYTEIHYARELAYSTTALISNYLVGNVTLLSITSKLNTFISNCFTLLNNWQHGIATDTQFYIRPFMMSIIVDALIYYHENIQALTQSQKDQIRDAVFYVETTMWRSADTHPSLKFTSVRLDTMNPNVPNTFDQSELVAQNQDPANQDGPGTDVELMFLQPRAWLYSQGYGTFWRDRFDLALHNNYPHYDNTYHVVYGAFIGSHSLAGVDAKKVSEQFWRFPDACKYREAGDLLIGSFSGVQGYQVYPQGLAQDWIRNANSSSKSAVNTLATTGYAISGPNESFLSTDVHGAVETAYALMAHLENINCGVAANSARISTLKGYAMGHITKWNAFGSFGGASLVRPYVCAANAKALIQYHDDYSADATITTALTTLWEWIWTNMWGVTDPKGHLTFHYTNIDTTTLDPSSPSYNTGGTESGSDLNLLIVPVFGWLYKQTGDTKWKDRGDIIFDNGVPIYDNTGLHIKGTYLGDARSGYAGVSGKHIDQSFWWSTKYLEWTAIDIVVPPLLAYKAKSKYTIYSLDSQNFGKILPATIAGSASITRGNASLSASGSVAAYDITNYITGGTVGGWYTPWDNSTMLNASVAAAANNDGLASVNPKRGTATLSQSTSGSRPIYKTNISGGQAAMEFDGTKLMSVGSFSSGLNGVTSINFGVVFKLLGTALNGSFFKCFDHSFSFSRFRPFLAGNQLSLDASRQDGTAHSTITATATFSTGTVHAAIYRWNISTGKLWIDANNAATSVSNTTFDTSGTMANTTLNQPEVGGSLNADVLDWFLITGSLMDSTQLSNWFAKVKSFFGITVY